MNWYVDGVEPWELVEEALATGADLSELVYLYPHLQQYIDEDTR